MLKICLILRQMSNEKGVSGEKMCAVVLRIITFSIALAHRVFFVAIDSLVYNITPV